MKPTMTPMDEVLPITAQQAANAACYLAGQCWKLGNAKNSWESEVILSTIIIAADTLAQQARVTAARLGNSEAKA